jgi:hypothetical protein
MSVKIPEPIALPLEDEPKPAAPARRTPYTGAVEFDEWLAARGEVRRAIGEDDGNLPTAAVEPAGTDGPADLEEIDYA